MTIVAGNGRFLMEYLHRRTEAHYQHYAGLLCRVAKIKPYLRLANKNKRLRWAK
jgi:hypothetical protein